MSLIFLLILPPLIRNCMGGIGGSVIYVLSGRKNYMKAWQGKSKMPPLITPLIPAFTKGGAVLAFTRTACFHRLNVMLKKEKFHDAR
jgi:hypothetical protein